MTVKCPHCSKGSLVPLSISNRAHFIWVCVYCKATLSLTSKGEPMWRDAKTQDIPFPGEPQE